MKTSRETFVKKVGTKVPVLRLQKKNLVFASHPPSLSLWQGTIIFSDNSPTHNVQFVHILIF